MLRYDFGVSEEIGRRPSMEDRTMVVQDLGVTALQKVGLSPQTYAAVYDGHGGVAASSFLWQKLHMNIAEALRRNATRITTILNGKLAKLAGSEALRELDDVVCRMLKEAFLTTDYEFINSSRQNTDGSTASTVLMLGSRLYCANVGDSRTVRYNSITHRVPNRGSVKVLKRGSQVFPLSQDHVPYREDEQARIERAGGFVLYRRVMGELAVSRAFGDAEFKTSTAGRGVVCEEPLTSPRADAGHPPASPHAEDVVPQQSLSEQLNDLLSPKIKPKTRARRGPAYTPKTVLEPDRPVERSRASSERENEEEIFARANSLAICVAEQAEASDSKKVAEALSRPKTRSPRFSDVLPSPLQMNRKGLQAVDRRSDKPGAPTPSPSLVMSPIAAQEPLSPGPRRGPTRRSLGEPQNSVPGSMMVRMPGHAHRGRKATSEGLLPDDEEDRCIGGDEMSAPGNALFAKTIITAEPDIVVRELEEGADDMLLMACDGLFDVFSNEV
jgi:serine/threonine protein phosphatase PrpC